MAKEPPNEYLNKLFEKKEFKKESKNLLKHLFGILKKNPLRNLNSHI